MIRADGRGTRALILVTGAFRLIYTAQTRMSRLGGASPLAALGGACVAGTAALLWRRARGRAPKTAALLWLPLLWADGAAAIHALSVSAGRWVLYALPPWALALATGAAMGLFALWGMGAAAGAGRLFLPWAAALMAGCAWAGRESLVPGWLFPLLGPGPGETALCALELGACLMPALLLPAAGDEGPGFSLLWAGVAAAAALAACAMTAPYMPSAPQTEGFRLEILLSNGRVPLPLQMPVLLLWFGGAILTAGSGAALCRETLAGLWPGMDERALALLSAAGPTAAYCTGLWEGARSFWPLWYPLALIPLIPGAAKRRKKA